MASSEVSGKANCSNGRVESFSSGCSEPHEGEISRNGVSDANRGLSGALAAGKDSEDALYSEFWHACAGPLVTVPRQGERIFYFPQQHIEQVKASTNQVADQQMPVYDLRSKILCRVINVQLKAEPDTDEVFAQVTLLPEIKKDENTVEKETLPPPPPRPHVHSFCKTLTASDTGSTSMVHQCIIFEIIMILGIYNRPVINAPNLGPTLGYSYQVSEDHLGHLGTRDQELGYQLVKGFVPLFPSL